MNSGKNLWSENPCSTILKEKPQRQARPEKGLFRPSWGETLSSSWNDFVNFLGDMNHGMMCVGLHHIWDGKMGQIGGVGSFIDTQDSFAGNF